MRRFSKPPTGICIHHSLTKDGTAADAAAIRKYHIETNGWDDIGYHALVERVNGEVKILPGRDEAFCGAHCPELNATHLGICVVGNFDLAPPDDELLAALQDQCEAWMQKYPISLRSVTYHCDHSQKTCPGKLFPQTGFLLALAGEERP